MRLIKKVKFSRVKEIVQFKKLDSTFNKLKIKDTESQIGNVKDLSRLNFYFIMEYINLIQEKINYKKIFPESVDGVQRPNLNILLEEQDKLKKYVDDKQSNSPEFFKKLGILNEVVGCFLIATTKKNIRSIQKLDLLKKDQSIVIKLDKLNLPKEFEQICSEFSKNQQKFIEKEHEEFEKFMKMSNEEKDTIIQDILHNIQFPPILFMDIQNDENSEEQPFYEFMKNEPHTATTIETAAENSIDYINDKEFLNAMLTAALEKEKYELCAKIRDRLLFLNFMKIK